MQDRKAPPSSRWTSYEGWDYGSMKQRLEKFMGSIDKQAFVTHADTLLGKKFAISEPFAAGQHWACFELIADDGSLVIARARLPRHPDTPSDVMPEDEVYTMDCEAATMQFLRLRLPQVPCPRLYGYAAPGSESAALAGCAYMLIEGFYGNTLEDVQFDICQLSIPEQEHIMSQWTTVQAQLATLTSSKIGSICQVSEQGEPVIGKLSSAPFEGLPTAGPFSDAASYFRAAGQGKLNSICTGSDHGNDNGNTLDDDGWIEKGVLVFLDIVENTATYDREISSFHFNHMDMGTQNILVDDEFNFLAIIDWEFAQFAPWEINHYPMPFPQVSSPAELEYILQDSSHIAYDNVLRQSTSRTLYRQGFLDAERRLQLAGRKLTLSVADLLDCEATKIYSCFEKLGVFPGQAEALTIEMVRLAFGYTGDALQDYLSRLASPRAGSSNRR